MDAPTDPRHDHYDWLRGHHPVWRDEASSAFILTGHAHCRALLADNTLWKDADRAEAGALVRTFKPDDMNRPGDRNSGIGWMDNPEHARVRPVIAQALNRRVARSRGAIEAIVADRLAALSSSSAFDVVGDFAAPIPILTIGLLFGIDAARIPRFRTWSEAALKVFLPDRSAAQAAEIKAASEAIDDAIAAALTERRAHPGEDLISDLASAQAAGAPVSDSEIRVNCMNLLLGGAVTTADLIASGVWLLLRHPRALAALRADEGLIGAVVEEVLRFEPAVEGSQRIAPRDMEIAGCPIRATQVVAVCAPAANRDPDVFAAPHHFDIARRAAPHLSFGGGAHICIGAALARLEAQCAILGLMKRFPTLRLADPSAPPRWRPIPFFRGLEDLPVAV